MWPVLGQGELLADRCSQPDGVALAQSADHRGRDEAAVDWLDVELHPPRGMRSVRGAEVAPQAWPLRDLHRNRLPSAVGELLPRRDLYHGNFDRASLDRYHIRLPVGRRNLFMLLGCGDHDLGNQPVRLRPGVGQIGGPRVTEELLQGREQAGPDR